MAWYWSALFFFHWSIFFLHPSLEAFGCKVISIAVSHQTEFDTRSFIMGILGKRDSRTRVGTRALLDYVGYRLTFCNVSQMTLQGLGLTNCDVNQARLPAHRLNSTRRSSAMLCLLMILRPLNGGLAKAGEHSASNLSLTLIPHPVLMPDPS